MAGLSVAKIEKQVFHENLRLYVGAALAAICASGASFAGKPAPTGAWGGFYEISRACVD
jgi:hypothetical protein